ncbi:Nickel and cobalt resistance protein CnrA [Enhygromyxa salina]|uniref:Nickel and cobalt resistance protein CnrA n=1 Tax=Enhygromyxa salina TaxID=215803 RepID=A0A2S9YGT7_9BACT|nr:Nickel and cobalt resistance protein CnrA [Enhygromyxa salina]
MLGVVANPGVDLVRFGDELRAELDALEAEVQAELDDPSLTLELVVDQPRYVAARLLDLQRSLLLSTLIVALVLLVAMGPRLALVSSAMVPLAVLSAVAVFGIGGGVLHQISLAGGVIAIGMVVDNAIVVVEEIQRRLDEGEAPPEAARASARALLNPLAASTATTVAAFFPMLLNSGAAADFTRAIPVMVILALLTSFAFSLFVLPPVASLVLRPRRRASAKLEDAEAKRPTRSLGLRVVDRLLRRPALALLPGLAMIIMAATALPSLRVRFFPPTKRNQAVVELQLREGTHVDAVAAVSETVEEELLGLDAVEQLTVTLGRGLPHFYYNLPETKAQSNFAQMLVQLRAPEEVEAVEARVDALRTQLPPGTKLRVARLKQGPPVVAPVELLLYSPGLDELRTSARAVAEALAEVEGLTAIRDSIDAGAPSLRFDLDRARNQPWGVDEAALRASLLSHTAGLPAGTVLHGRHHEPVVVRAAPRRAELEAPPAIDLPADLAVAGTRGQLRVAEVSERRLEWAPAAITRKYSKRFARVTAELEPGVELDAVRGAIEARVAALELDDAGVTVAFAGEAESAEEANDSLLRALPVGLVILVLVLVWEFDSLRCVGLVLVTVPLAAVGVIPALAVSGQPFGFMSALGVVALIGVVVNNAIVLLDLTQQLRAEGRSTREAVHAATLRRVRPILLTTATTVVGLIPLLVSNTSLWPPLALTIISGLLASTVLTLVTLPALAMLVLPLGAHRSTRTR